MGPIGEKGIDGLRGADGERGPEGPDGKPGRDGRDGVQGLQGEKGMDGAAGRDGINGRDGTLENIKLVRRSERVIEFCFKDGTPIEGGTVKLNHPVFKGTFSKDATYDEGDILQWGSSSWIALKDQPTGIPGHVAKEVGGWQQFSKPGRDGKDGKEGAPGKPGRDFTKETPSWQR